MKKTAMLALLVLGVLVGGSSLVWAQQAPDTILYNGKIVTVDEHGVNGNLGTIAQAIAVRGDRIQAVGTTSQIRALAGPSTKSIDLKGRTVIPGLAATHDHPQLWDPMNPYIMQKVVNDNMHLERFLWEGTPEEKLQKLPRVLEEAVQKAKPGQWIRISMLEGRKYDRAETEQLASYMGRQINKQMLDLAAPNNPVLIRQGLLAGVLNQKGIDAIKKFYGERWSDFLGNPPPEREQTGVGFASVRKIEEDVIYPPEELREILRLGGTWWAGYGLTMNSTAIYAAGALREWDRLDRSGQMGFRLPWSWRAATMDAGDAFFNPVMLANMVAQQGRGSDYLWLIGFWGPGEGSTCSSLPGTSPEAKKREAPCGLDPNTPANQKDRAAFYNLIKAGGRLSGAHTDGDRNMDFVMDIVEQASKDAGFTADEIRAKRHSWDHLAYNPRPDQIPRIRNLGIVLGGWDLYIWEQQGKNLVLKNYGEEATQWVVPRKNLLDAGVRQSVEIDRPLGYTDLTFFTVLQTGVTRKDQNGNLFAPQQAVSREVMLKSATLSGAYMTLREDRLGSLESGKFADLIVLDRDYLTIPADDISKIRVLMTMLGGKVTHLVPSLARELGMQPTGSQVALGGAAAQW